MVSLRGSHLGVAVGLERVFAARLDRRGWPEPEESLWSRPIDPPQEEDGENEWPGLSNAFVALAEELECRGAVLHVALLPPLAQVRRVELPRMRDDELRQVLARDSRRHFMGVKEARIAAGFPLTRERGYAPVLAASAPAWIVEAVHAHAIGAGFRLGRIVPAQLAWSVGALRDRRIGQDGQVLALLPDAAELVELERGCMIRVRRLPAEPGVELLSPPLMLLGPMDRCDSVREAIFASQAADESARSPVVHIINDSAEAFAARHAAGGRSLEFLPHTVVQERSRRSIRRTWRFAGAAAVLFLLAASLLLQGIERRTDTLRAARAELAPAVAEAMAARDVILRLEQVLRSLGELEATAPRWSRVMANIANELPDDAVLRVIDARGDSLVMEGQAARAATVFEGMQASPALASVRSGGPIERERDAEERVVERFRLSASVAIPASGPPADPVPSPVGDH